MCTPLSARCYNPYTAPTLNDPVGGVHAHRVGCHGDQRATPSYPTAVAIPLFGVLYLIPTNKEIPRHKTRRLSQATPHSATVPPVVTDRQHGGSEPQIPNDRTSLLPASVIPKVATALPNYRHREVFPVGTSQRLPNHTEVDHALCQVHINLLHQSLSL